MDRREFIEKSLIEGTAMTISGSFGCSEPLYFPKALDAAAGFSPVTDKENANLQKIAQSVEPIFKV